GPTISARWVRKAMTSCLVARIDEIERETKHDVIAFLTDLGEMGEEGDDVVLGLALDLVDAGDVESGVLGLGPDRLGGVLRDHAELGQRVRRMRLDLEPDLEPG